MTIGTHLLLFLIANENLKLATSYHIAVEPQSTIQYNGHIVSILPIISSSSIATTTKTISIKCTKR